MKLNIESKFNINDKVIHQKSLRKGTVNAIEVSFYKWIVGTNVYKNERVRVEYLDGAWNWENPRDLTLLKRINEWRDIK